MPEIIKGNPELLTGLERLCVPNGVKYTFDDFGNAFNWYRLRDPYDILEAARLLHQEGARLAMVTAYNQHKEHKHLHDACYEFVLTGVVYSCTIHMDEEHQYVPSISRLFPNADWHEREMMELYGILIKDHPNPRRLFLDEKLDQGLLGKVVPLSIVMNGASSTDLWERILSARGEK